MPVPSLLREGLSRLPVCQVARSRTGAALKVRGAGSGGPGFRSQLCTSICVSSGKSSPLAAPYCLLYKKGKVGPLGKVNRILRVT